MKNSSKLSIAALGGATLLVLTGCSGGAAPAPDGGGSETVSAGTIAYSPTSAQLPILVESGKIVEKLAAEDGWKYTFIDGEFDPAIQNQQVTQALDSGSIQALWLAPVAGPAALPLVKHVMELGVPTLVQTSPEDVGLEGPQKGIVFQHPNFVSFGTALGEEVNACVAEKGLDNPEAIVFSAPDTLPGTNEITSGAKAAYEGSVKVVAESQVADIATAQTQTQQLLIANPNAKVVIATAEEGALGAINAYKAAGLTPECIILGGGGPDAIAAQESGDITTVVAFDFVAAMPLGWEALQLVIADPEAEGAILEIPFAIKK